MVRTHVWLLFPSPPPEGSFLKRIWIGLLAWLRRSPSALTGPIDLGGRDELSQSLKQTLGSRYCCLPVVARPCTLLDEALRELMPKERLVLVFPESEKSKTTKRIVRNVFRCLNDKNVETTAIFIARELAFVVEARAWLHRVVCIDKMKSRVPGSVHIPVLEDSRPYVLGMAHTIRQAEREAGWVVPEDWIRTAVARAWEAIDRGVSVEEATALPAPASPVFPWMDDLLEDCPVDQA